MQVGCDSRGDMEGATKKHRLTSISNGKCKKKNDDDRGQTWMKPKSRMKNTLRTFAASRSIPHTSLRIPFICGSAALVGAHGNGRS